MSNTINLVGRGSPVQSVHPGPSSCTQMICSAEGCVDNGVTFRCMSIVKPAYDISFLGRTMQCDAITSPQHYPWLSCSCEWDPVNCEDNGVKSQFGPAATSVAGLTGYVADTTVIGGPTSVAGGSSGATTTPGGSSGTGSSGNSGSGGSHGGAAASIYSDRVGVGKMISLVVLMCAVLA